MLSTHSRPARGAASCAVALALFAAPDSRGAFQTWTATGVITNLAESPGVTGGATTWTAVITVDTSATDQAPGDTSLGQYAVTLDVTVGATFASLSGLMQVFNDPSGVNDQFAITADPQATGPWSAYSFQLLLAGSGSMYADDGMPAAPPDPNSHYSEAIWQAIYPDSTGFQAYGHATSFVPAPGGLALFALCGVAARRRRGAQGV